MKLQVIGWQVKLFSWNVCLNRIGLTDILFLSFLDMISYHYISYYCNNHCKIMMKTFVGVMIMIITIIFFCWCSWHCHYYHYHYCHINVKMQQQQQQKQQQFTQNATVKRTDLTGRGCSSVARASERYPADAGSVSWCSIWVFSPSQLSVQTLLRVSVQPPCAIACIDICAQVTDRAVHVKVDGLWKHQHSQHAL